MIVLPVLLLALAAFLAVPSGSSLLLAPAPRAEERRKRPLPVRLLSGLGSGLIVAYLFPRPFSLIGAVIVGLVAARVVGNFEPLEARRRRAMLEAQMPQVVDLLTASLASGAAPTSALSLAAGVVAEPMASELRGEVAKLRLGADPSQVWRSMSHHGQLGPLGRALQRATEVGAPVGESLERLADELRAVRRSQVLVRARSIEAKVSAPLGACILPSFIVVGVVPLLADQLASTALF